MKVIKGQTWLLEEELEGEISFSSTNKQLIVAAM